MRYLAKGVIVWLIGGFFCCCVWAQSSQLLIQKAGEFNGKEVTFEGEVIGEILRRGDFAWLNIHDGENAVGVWVSSEELADLRWAGSYRQRGDRVAVRGIFHRACLEHGGVLDIHARGLIVISPGGLTTELISRTRIRTAVVLMGVLICFLIVFNLRNRQ